MGFLRMFLAAFVPATVFAQLWAYGHLSGTDRAVYLTIAIASYLLPLAAAAAVSVVAHGVGRVVRRRQR